MAKKNYMLRADPKKEMLEDLSAILEFVQPMIAVAPSGMILYGHLFSAANIIANSNFPKPNIKGLNS